MCVVRVSLIELQNGLRAMLISDNPVNEADNENEASDDIGDKSKRHKRRTARRDAASDDSVMQAWHLLYRRHSTVWTLPTVIFPAVGHHCPLTGYTAW